MLTHMKSLPQFVTTCYHRRQIRDLSPHVTNPSKSPKIWAILEGVCSLSISWKRTSKDLALHATQPRQDHQRFLPVLFRANSVTSLSSQWSKGSSKTFKYTDSQFICSMSRHQRCMQVFARIHPTLTPTNLGEGDAITRFPMKCNFDQILNWKCRNAASS